MLSPKLTQGQEKYFIDGSLPSKDARRTLRLSWLPFLSGHSGMTETGGYLQTCLFIHKIVNDGGGWYRSISPEKLRIVEKALGESVSIPTGAMPQWRCTEPVVSLPGSGAGERPCQSTMNLQSILPFGR